MKGLCEEGILLLPKRETYDQRDSIGKSNFNKGVRNIINYMEKMGIKLRSFSTSEVALLIYPEKIGWINPLTEEDFMYAEMVYGRKRLEDEIDLPTEVYDIARKKYPSKKGMSKDERLAMIEKRDKLICNKAIQAAKLVITLEKENNMYYKPAPSIDDERVIMYINPNTLLVRVMIAGEQVPVEYILMDLKNPYSSVDEWEVN